MYPEVDTAALEGGLPLELADVMVENCIGTLALPLGLGLGVTVNGRTFNVPMAVEEPSIIAAISGSAKLVNAHGGLQGSGTGNIMIGQVQLLDVHEPRLALARIQEHRDELVAKANRFCPKMVERGGGVRNLHARLIEPRRGGAPSLVVHLELDVCEAMGANITNTVAEGIAPDLARVTGGRVGLRILSNLSTGRMARASFRIPVSALHKGDVDGALAAAGVVEAQHFAEDDAYRAATHNKGVMNGIDAVALAMGQDWRAIEAGAHAWAARSGSYQPLTSYALSEDGRFLSGSIEVPMAVGTKGGALQTHPSYRLGLAVMGNPDAQTLAQVMAAVGLLQNFAALRALSGEGIQRGHMSLHARNIAVAAGSPSELVAEVAAYMVSTGRVDSTTASAYLAAHHLFRKQCPLPTTDAKPPSTLRVVLETTDSGEEPFTLDVVFDTLGEKNVHLDLSETPREASLEAALFGVKGAAWLGEAFSSLSQIRLRTKAPARANSSLQTGLKLKSMLQNLLVHRLMAEDAGGTAAFVRQMVAGASRETLFAMVPRNVPALSVGLPLAWALYDALGSSLTQWVGDVPLAHVIREEEQRVLSALVAPTKRTTLEEMMPTHTKRLHATLNLLCDALSMSPHLITEERLGLLRHVGEQLEWAATCLHDVARYERDGATDAPNAYRVWLEETGATPDPASQRAFLAGLSQRLIDVEKALAASAADTEAWFDASLFTKTVAALREHYGLSRN